MRQCVGPGRRGDVMESLVQVAQGRRREIDDLYDFALARRDGHQTAAFSQT